MAVDTVVLVKTKVVQVANIAPQATRDQMQTLFGYLGKVEDLRLYPIARDVSIPVQSRICYVKFFDEKCVGISQHLTNTVFIDRALAVTPYHSGEIPDEQRALEIAAQQQGVNSGEKTLPAHITNQIEGVPPNQVISTHDPVLIQHGLPPYPTLPISYDTKKIEEIRRTLVAINIEESVTAQELVDFFQKVGTVNYIRFCSRENDSQRYALVEFSDQSHVIPALKLNGTTFKGKTLQMYHSTQTISKPEAKSNEAAQREIEEAMSRVKEAQNLISAAIDPVIGILSKDKKKSHSPSRRHRSRSRSRGRRRRSRSRSRRRSRSRHRSRSRQRSHRGRRSRTRSRDRKRSRSRGSKRRSRDRKRSRSRGRRSASRDRKRSSRSKRHSRSRSRKRSPRRDDKKRDRKAGSVRKRSRSKTRDKSKSSSRSPPVKSKSRSVSRSVSRRRSPSPRKTSRKTSRSTSRKPSRSTSRKPSRSPRKGSRSPSRKTSRSPSRKASRSPSRKGSRSPRKASRSPSRKNSRSPPRKMSLSPSKSGSPGSPSPGSRKRERSPTWGGSVSPPRKARSRSAS
ncbi:hypothetical protein WDU94_011451 [Cyamophila willieti]